MRVRDRPITKYLHLLKSIYSTHLAQIVFISHAPFGCFNTEGMKTLKKLKPFNLNASFSLFMFCKIKLTKYTQPY